MVELVKLGNTISRDCPDFRPTKMGLSPYQVRQLFLRQSQGHGSDSTYLLNYPRPNCDVLSGEQSMMMNTETAWRVPASHPALNSREVHVWRASLLATSEQFETLRDTLSDDEIARADRLRLENKRNEFIVARGVLRTILGRYLDVQPASLAFSYSGRGKPELAATVGRELLCFNLSHSGDWLLCAFAAGRQVGVDIERHHPVGGLDAIVRRFFSAGERAAIHSLPEEQKLASFFRFWTLKEAYVKAQGIGLSYPLDQFDVTLTPSGPPTLCNAQGDAAQWSCVELPVDPGYSAALVAAGHGWRSALAFFLHTSTG